MAKKRGKIATGKHRRHTISILHSSQHSLVEREIERLSSGDVFCIADFNDIGSDKTISKILARLCKEGKCNKILPGVYCKPGAIEPSAPDMAKAIARSNAWQVAPCGDTALHLIGLGEEPTIWTYITDGKYRSYCIGKITITFKHATKKVFSEISDDTVQFVQILSAFRDKCKVRIPGKAQIERLIQHIDTYFSKAQKERIAKESGKLSAWFRKIADLSFKTPAREHK